LSHIKEFYNNVVFLWRVTETDDPDYNIYMTQLRRHIAGYQVPTATATERVPNNATHTEEEEERIYQEERARREWERSQQFDEPPELDDTDWLAKEREDWTESIRSKNRNGMY
jgi:hypothetical protein